MSLEHIKKRITQPGTHSHNAYMDVVSAQAHERDIPNYKRTREFDRATRHIQERLTEWGYVKDKPLDLPDEEGNEHYIVGLLGKYNEENRLYSVKKSKNARLITPRRLATLANIFIGDIESPVDPE